MGPRSGISLETGHQVACKSTMDLSFSLAPSLQIEIIASIQSELKLIDDGQHSRPIENKTCDNCPDAQSHP